MRPRIESNIRIRAKMGTNGFGNEFVKLAKLLVCRKELGVAIEPSYWCSPYRFALPNELCYVGKPRRIARLIQDRLVYRRIEFGRDEHLETNCIPVAEAFSVFLKNQDLDPKVKYLVEFTGFDPGLDVIEGQGSFLFNTLESNAVIAEVLDQRTKQFDPKKVQIGVHIRQGDFRPALPLGMPWPEGQWNIQIPIAWYDRICGLLSKAFPRQIEFFVTTNGSGDDVKAFCQKHEAPVVLASSSRLSPDVADLLTLASCDGLIGSASWFSGWPVVLKPKPWIWYGCAHGMPPWGCKTASVYVNEPSLPEEFLISIERLLAQKRGLS